MKKTIIVALVVWCSNTVFLKPAIAKDAEKINWDGSHGNAEFSFLRIAQEGVLPMESPRAKIVSAKQRGAAPAGNQNAAVEELKKLYSERHFRLTAFPPRIDLVNAVVVAKDAGRARIEQTIGHTVPPEIISVHSSNKQFGPEPTYSGYGIQGTAGETAGYTLRFIISRSGEMSIRHFGPDFFVDLYYTGACRINPS